MAVGEVVNVSGDLIGNIIVEIGRIGLILQTLGVIAVIWVVVQIINIIMNRKKRKAIYSIQKDLKRIEGKINKLLGNNRS